MKDKSNKKLNKYVALFFSVIIMISSMLGCSLKKPKNNLKPKVIIDSENKSKIVDTIVEDKKIYVSLKGTFEYLGGKFKSSKDEFIAKKDNDTLKIFRGNKNAYLNENKIKINEEPKFKKEDVYVPIEFLNEVIDARVTFDFNKNFLNIKTELPLKYTKAFSVRYLKGGLKRVIDGDKRTLILVPNGKNVPSEYKNETVINIPVDNVLISSTTQACFLRALKEIKSIDLVTTPESQWEINEIKENMKKDKIRFIGDNATPNYEQIKVLKPSVTFIYSGVSGLQSVMKKFNELNIKYAVINEHIEENPMGRLEWIKFIASFYNKEEVAEEYFNNTIEKVEEITKKVGKYKKPKVAWGMLYNGKVYVAKPDSYTGKMIEMTGGDYIFKNEKIGLGSITLEQFYSKAKDADIFIYSSLNQYSPNLKTIINEAPILKNMKAIKEKNVYCFNNDYYQSLDKTGELVNDLAAIFHQEIYKEYKIKHYIKYKE